MDKVVCRENDLNCDLATNTQILEFIIVVIFRCLGIVHCFYRFRKIHRIGSSFIMTIAASYLGLIFFIYSLVVMSLGTPDFNVLVDSYFLILLLLDMSKVTRMAQFALSSSHQVRISENLAHSMFVLAPTLVLNTLATTLMMGTGLLTGFQRLELLSRYAIIYQVVNFLIYVTFYPAGLSLLLELMYTADGRPGWDVRHIINTLPKEDSQSPVVHHVRVTATAMLMILHVLCRWPLVLPKNPADLLLSINSIILFAQSNALQIIIILSVVAVGFKYLLFYKDIDEAFELRCTYILARGDEEMTKKLSEDREAEGVDHSSNSTDEGISIGGNNTERCVVEQPERPRARMFIRGGSDDSSSESAWSEMFVPELKDQEAQTNFGGQFMSPLPPPPPPPVVKPEVKPPPLVQPVIPAPFSDKVRPLQECLKISRQPNGYSLLSDDEVIQLVEAKYIRSHMLEKVLGDHLRGVEVRRKTVLRQAGVQSACLNKVPYHNYDYEMVMGACAESVIGYMTVPLGTVGPLKLDGKEFMIPMATTEGCLVASTNRGCSALRSCGVISCLTNDGMSRAPVLRFPNIARAAEARMWIKDSENFEAIKREFDSTSRFARLQKIDVHTAGRSIYVRFVATTGDAMGMNMLSKATEHALLLIQDFFPDVQILSLSGNVCTDKKPAAINWIEGRGKSVTCQAIIPGDIIETTLKTTTSALCDLNIAKNLTGSAIAGSIGGFNAHAANIVTAIFIATGQDAAQNIASSNCITLMEPWGEDGRDLYMTCTMPSIEVGTVGGGTVLAAQGACLEMLGVKGSHPTSPGDNARQLARIICATVLAGELSLMSALAAGHLVKSHLRHNRSTANFNTMPGTLPNVPNVMSCRTLDSFFHSSDALQM